MLRNSLRPGPARSSSVSKKAHQGVLLIVRQIQRPDGRILIRVWPPGLIIKLDHIFQGVNAAIVHGRRLAEIAQGRRAEGAEIGLALAYPGARPSSAKRPLPL